MPADDQKYCVWHVGGLDKDLEIRLEIDCCLKTDVENGAENIAERRVTCPRLARRDFIQEKFNDWSV
jgi:hypothetical protein